MYLEVVFMPGELDCLVSETGEMRARLDPLVIALFNGNTDASRRRNSSY